MAGTTVELRDDVRPPPTASAQWTVVVAGGTTARDRPAPRLRTVLVQISLAAAVIAIVVAVVGTTVSRHAAESEAVRDAAELTNVLADTVVQPALTDAMADDPIAARAIDPVVRAQLLNRESLVRVKVWTPAGEILYSDEPALVGRRFTLDDDARAALSDPQVSANVSDLDEPENQFERSMGQLLEVHRPVWTPNGSPLLFEAYYRYDRVAQRADSIWRGFAGITLGSIGAVAVLLVPLAWTLVSRARRAQRHRELLMRRAVEASLDERRRIAADLHDGVVQDLVAASFAVGGGAAQAAGQGDTALAVQLRAAQETVRSTISGMRTLLVDIYPPNLHDAGLAAALGDTAAALRLELELAIDEVAVTRLSRDQVEAVFRFVQEALRNVSKHAPDSAVILTVHADPDNAVVVEVADEGPGLPESTSPEGHFGLRLLEDIARGQDAELAVRTAPGEGTAWQLRIPMDGR